MNVLFLYFAVSTVVLIFVVSMLAFDGEFRAAFLKPIRVVFGDRRASKIVAMSGAFALTVLLILPYASASAQTATPAPANFDFSGIFNGFVTSANRWIQSLSPIFNESAGIQIAVALLGLVVVLIVGAFAMIRGRGNRS